MATRLKPLKHPHNLTYAAATKPSPGLGSGNL
jgi:hypothetical protein